MNLFVILIKYGENAALVEQTRPKHREFLASGYERGFLLASGPCVGFNGGCVIGKFNSKKEAQDFCFSDPYALANAATHDILEFNAVFKSEILNEFLS